MKDLSFLLPPLHISLILFFSLSFLMTTPEKILRLSPPSTPLLRFYFPHIPRAVLSVARCHAGRNLEEERGAQEYYNIMDISTYMLLVDASTWLCRFPVFSRRFLLMFFYFIFIYKKSRVDAWEPNFKAMIFFFTLGSREFQSLNTVLKYRITFFSSILKCHFSII